MHEADGGADAAAAATAAANAPAFDAEAERSDILPCGPRGYDCGIIQYQTCVRVSASPATVGAAATRSRAAAGDATGALKMECSINGKCNVIKSILMESNLMDRIPREAAWR